MRPHRAVLMPLVLLALILSSAAVWAAPLRNHPNVITQPDGTVLHLLVTGDEYFRRIHDTRNFTIIQDPATGYFVYAARENGRLVPTSHIAGRVNPSDVGIVPGLAPDAAHIEKIRQAYWGLTRSQRAPVKSEGSMNQLVIFVRFAGENEFTTPATTYNAMLNNSTAGANSLKNFYKDMSYNKLTITSYLFPTPGTTVLSYEDTNSRDHYRPYSASNTDGYSDLNDRAYRESALLARALNAIKGSVPSDLNLDINEDGYIDALAFVIQGQADGWSDMLWSHMWYMYYENVYINGKMAYQYTFQMQDHAESAYGTAVFAHETFHMLGAPDLYRYEDQSITPVGPWDLMAEVANPPTHTNCYMKWKYGGWIDNIPEVTEAGVYTLNNATFATNQCLKVRSSQSVNQYFILEYRRRIGVFETSLPASGLLVWRINPSVQHGNADGPPDEVYIFRQGGGPSANGNIYSAALTRDGRNSFTALTDPYPFLSNGTRINDVSVTDVSQEGGDTIQFTVDSVPAESQCRPCSGSTPCLSGYFCTGYEGQTDKFCVKECYRADDPSCPTDTECQDFTTIWGCMPTILNTYCDGQALRQTDACENTLLLETCPEGSFCDAENAVCDEVCRPKTCDSLDKKCGSHPDGCDDVVFCGDCVDYPNSFCSPTGRCACGEDSCESLGIECDRWPDGCGGTLKCGTCPDELECKEGICVDPSEVEEDGDIDIPPCKGTCSVTDSPFCTADGRAFCQCDRGVWTRLECSAYCRDKRAVFDECVFDVFSRLDGCVCKGELPPDGDETDGDTPEEEKPSMQSGGSLFDCQTTEGNASWVLLLLFTLLWRLRHRPFA